MKLLCPLVVLFLFVIIKSLYYVVFCSANSLREDGAKALGAVILQLPRLQILDLG